MSITQQVLIEADQQFQVLPEWAWQPIPIAKWSVQQLLDALDDQTLKRTARKEINRRISLNKSTSLVVRMFLPKSIRDADDAFQGLCRTCFVALGNLYFSPRRGDGLAENKFDATRDFIESAIPGVLRPYFGKTEKQILAAALTDKFRHVPRAVKFDAIDALRSFYRSLENEPEFIDLSYVLGNDEASHPLTFEDILARPEGKEDNSSLLSAPSAKARHKSDKEIMEHFTTDRARWIALLGEPGWVTLITVVKEYANGSADGTRRDWKGKVSSAVAKRRGVSRVQAQADLRNLRAKMSVALGEEFADRKKIPLVSKAWELFSAPESELPGLGTYRHKKHSAGTLLSPGGSEKGNGKGSKMTGPLTVANVPRRKFRAGNDDGGVTATIPTTARRKFRAA